MLNIEIWQTIKDLPYEISNLGNVKRQDQSKYKHKGKNNIKPYLNHHGYLCVHLYKESKMYSFLIHRLIATAFIPNPNNLPIINHIDGNALNNSISNLEWCTHQHNSKHAWDIGLQTNRYCNASLKRKNSSSEYRGVSWSEERKRWCAGIGFNKKKYALGRFIDEIEAAKAHDNFIKEKNLLQFGYKLNFN